MHTWLLGRERMLYIFTWGPLSNPHKWPVFDKINSLRCLYCVLSGTYSWNLQCNMNWWNVKIYQKMGKKEKRDQRYRESMTESEPVVKETEYGKRIYSGFHFDWLIDRYEMASWCILCSHVYFYQFWFLGGQTFLLLFVVFMYPNLCKMEYKIHWKLIFYNIFAIWNRLNWRW